MLQINLPIDYRKLTSQQRKEVREIYIKQQQNLCMYCNCSLSQKAPKEITDIKINWSLFPAYFLRYPIHLQHNHNTGLTEGAVHNYCNAVMWEYEGR
jgi:hypothetical protein